MISAGRLIHLLTIEKITGNSQSNRGSTLPVWTGVDEAYAEIKPLHGRNVEIALMKTKGKSVSHMITMRYNPLVSEVTSRFNFRGRIFEIFSVVNVLERSIDLEVLCNEITA